MGYNSSVCFYPDGSTRGSKTNPQMVPCDPSAEHSACCTPNESCTSAGFCYSGLGRIYRGACTDPTFNHESCPKHCLNGQNKTEDTGVASYTDFLNLCGMASTEPIWSCQSTKCNETTFAFMPGPIKYFNITGNFTTTSLPSTSTSPVSEPASTVSPQSTPASSSNNSTVIGAAIGVPLGVLFLIAATLAIIFWRKTKSIAAQPPHYQYYGHPTAYAHPAQELPAFGKPGELDARQDVVELHQ